ncbi:MAG TPA: glutamate-5-semialdehyde dehydrogenase [Candidatus Acidoferrales bacterium]|nr:glutamate-5-semialdehyde dehydrogenase [Candidatus Acidoferrales bacterium]
MSQTAPLQKENSVAAIARRAREASRSLARLSGERRNAILLAAAGAIEAACPQILEANALDRRTAEPDVGSGKMSSAMFKRLHVTESGIAEMAMRVREVARLDDPLGRTLMSTELDDNLTLFRESCPLGVIGVIFESRPEVVPQLASLALKSGNALILKGGAEAAHTNEVLVRVWRAALEKFSEVPADSVQLLQSRADVLELLALDRDVDLIVPRGSYELVHFIMEHSRIPVLGHGEGICHVYVDRSADIEKAIEIAYDAKVQYPAVCNAAETLLVHEEIAGKFLPAVVARMKEAGVEIRADAKTQSLLPGENIARATEADWSTEYGDMILSIKVVPDLSDAIDHINRYGSRHTDTIVTEDDAAAAKFMNEVDSAGVFQNASTRFADGFRYGFGAEVGISNSKLHARGPMGLEGLTTYKYKLYGNGHTVAPYAKGEKKFKHRPLS